MYRAPLAVTQVEQDLALMTHDKLESLQRKSNAPFHLCMADYLSSQWRCSHRCCVARLQSLLCYKQVAVSCTLLAFKQSCVLWKDLWGNNAFASCVLLCLLAMHRVFTCTGALKALDLLLRCGCFTPPR